MALWRSEGPKAQAAHRTIFDWLANATVDADRRHLRLDRGVRSVRKDTADVGTDRGAPPEAGGHGQGSVVLLAAFDEDPMTVPSELAGYRVLAGHGNDGPVATGGTASDTEVPSPGFLLLQRP